LNYQEAFLLKYKYDMELGKQLVDELIELWAETQIRCDKIESLVKQIKKETEK